MRSSRSWWLAVLLSVSFGAQSRARAQEPGPRQDATGQHPTDLEAPEARTVSGVERGQDKLFSLAQALRLMRSSHPALRSQGESIAAVEGDVDASSLWTNPEFESAYFKGVRKSSYDPLGYIYYGVTQFLELSNVPGTRRRMGKQLIVASRAEQVATLVQLTLDIESTLIDLVAAKRVEQLLTEVLSLIDSAGRIVNERVSAGAAPRYDASRIAVSLALAQADHTEAEAALSRAWAEFAAAVGPRAHELRGEPDYDLDSGPKLPDAETLRGILERTRPDVVAARAVQKAAEINVQVARRSVFSGIQVGLLGGYGAAPRQVDVGASLNLDLPLINRGQFTIPAASARARKATADVEVITVPASNRIEGMRREIEQRRQALRDYQARGVTSGDEMLHEAQAGYVAGRFSVLELADAYRAFRDARLREIALGAAARQAEVDLGRELGKPLRDL